MWYFLQWGFIGLLPCDKYKFLNKKSVKFNLGGFFMVIERLTLSLFLLLCA